MEYKVAFDNRVDAEFTRVLKQRVNDYFASSGLSRHHTPAMVFKTVVMLALYILPFVAMLIFGFPGWLNMLMYIVMGFGLAGIGMSVMHDANHFGYSSNQTVNRWVGLTISFSHPASVKFYSRFCKR